MLILRHIAAPLTVTLFCVTVRCGMTKVQRKSFAARSRRVTSWRHRRGLQKDTGGHALPRNSDGLREPLPAMIATALFCALGFALALMVATECVPLSQSRLSFDHWQTVLVLMAALLGALLCETFNVHPPYPKLTIATAVFAAEFLAHQAVYRLPDLAADLLGQSYVDTIVARIGAGAMRPKLVVLLDLGPLGNFVTTLLAG